jgi:hypothetical protein
MSLEKAFVSKVFGGAEPVIELKSGQDTEQAITKILTHLKPTLSANDRTVQVDPKELQSNYELASRIARYDLEGESVSGHDAFRLLVHNARIKFGPNYSAKKAWEDAIYYRTTPRTHMMVHERTRVIVETCPEAVIIPKQVDIIPPPPPKREIILEHEITVRNPRTKKLSKYKINTCTTSLADLVAIMSRIYKEQGTKISDKELVELIEAFKAKKPESCKTRGE